MHYNQGMGDIAVYEGDWRLNLRHGQGKMRWGDGSEFNGEWYMDRRRTGRMLMPGGDVSFIDLTLFRFMSALL